MYQGYKPVLWSTVEKTALADAEVEYKDHTSNTIFVGFKVKTSKIDLLKDTEIIIWTTTPWTIPANKALAYNSNLTYAIVKINDKGDFNKKKIVVAKDLLESVIKECDIKNFEIGIPSVQIFDLELEKYAFIWKDEDALDPRSPWRYCDRGTFTI